MKPKTNRTFARPEHPHVGLVENLRLPIDEMYLEAFDEPKFLERSLENVPLHWIDTEEALKEMYTKLKGESMIAVDLEHHSFHSYTGLVSLIQISSASEDFLVDPIRLREALQSEEMSLNCVLADSSILKLFHGAESDVAWLQRDFDTFVVNMFDSFHAAKVLNLPRMSLAYLLEHFCGVELDKTYQLADWRERPLPNEMIEYARKDTHYLHHLYHLLKGRLSREQYESVLERSNQQCLELYTPEVITSQTWKIVLDRSNFALNGDQVNLVRRLFYWREWKAKELDVSPPALMPNSYMAKIANSRVQTVSDLRGCLRNVSELMSKEFPALIEFLSGEESKESEITGIVKVFDPAVVGENRTIESTHIRFDAAPTEIEIEKVKLETPVKRTMGKVSFVPNSGAGATSVFSTPNGVVQPCAQVLLAALVQPLQTAAAVHFKTREEEASELAVESKKSEEVVVKVNAVIHGCNRVVEDLEIDGGGSTSTVLADKLRKNVGKSTGPRIEPFDYANMPSREESESEVLTSEIFDPYNTMKDAKKGAFIEATIAPATAPRLSATRLSGNRMASFTKSKAKAKKRK